MKNKKFLVATSLVMLLPMLAGLILWDRLPNELATHWGIDGKPDGWSSKPMAVFGLPLIMLAVHWLCTFVTKLDKRNRMQSEKILNLTLLICPILSLYLGVTVYCAALGLEPKVVPWATVFLGGLFMALGNYLPKCLRNSTVGIKLKWTLSSEENWNKTHRFAGKIWFWGGVILLVSGFAPDWVLHFLLPGTFVAMVAVPLVYSYRLYKRQVSEGRWP